MEERRGHRARFATCVQYDGVAISEFPDNETALACLMSIFGQGGLHKIKTPVLITPEEGQGAMAKAHNLVVGRGNNQQPASRA